jgi:hypothetical protein
VRRILHHLGAAALLALVPSVLHAQAVWDAPPLVSPHAPGGLSVLLASGNLDDIGVMAQWRRGRQGRGWGYRGGILQRDGDDASVFAGVDVSGVLATSVDEADIQVLWWSGVGAGVGDDVVVSVPLGLVAAWRGLGDGNAFAPYLGAHVAMDVGSGEGDALHLDASLDLGLDLTLTTGWVVRFGASLLGREALAVGIRVPS